jgi:hypothetical protein
MCAIYGAVYQFAASLGMDDVAARYRELFGDALDAFRMRFGSFHPKDRWPRAHEQPDRPVPAAQG